MSIYLLIVVVTLILGFFLPQKGKKRVIYIILISILHAFVCAFRYNHLTGDLMKYHYLFNQTALHSWFSEEIIQEGRNSGFFFLMKLVNHFTNGDFQSLLIVISLMIHTTLAYMIHRYSSSPWMSFLVWNCMSFYIFGFNAIKQALAMAFVMLSFIGIEENNPRKFLVQMMFAGLIHVPSLIFLPAYWLCQQRVTPKTLMLYLFLGTALYIFKNQFVDFIRSFYYEDDEFFFFSDEVGSRFIMLLGFTIFGILFRGFSNRIYEKLFHIMAVATILQMLAGFDNIFTRLTDYYFQFSVFYIPMTFRPDYVRTQKSLIPPVFPFNERSMKILCIVISAFIIWFYYMFSGVIRGVDHTVAYRFMWDLVP